jgi:two-component system, cell cycle response regulator
MHTHSNLNFLLASGEPDLLSALEPLLAECGAHVNIALAAEDALAVIAAPVAQSLLLLDVRLPGMETCQLLAAMRDAAGSRRFPIVLISDTVTEELLDRLAEGVIDDIVPRATAPEFWRVRIGSVMRGFRAEYDLEHLRESLALNAQFDRLTGVYNRDALLAMLFRETDRVQRMKSSLCMVLFDVDDFGHWNSRLGADACDGLLCQIVDRTTRLLRSYDLLGRVGEDEFLIAMPGCTAVNAMMLAERLRIEVFCEPFHVAGEVVRLSACFGISSSNGRSALVVLREAEHALAWARSAGPESILCFGESPQPAHAPVKFLSPATGDELLAW